MPIWIANNVRIYNIRGKIILPQKINFAMIRIGYHTIPIMDKSSSHTILNLNKNSILEFKGTAHIGMGSKINIEEKAKLVIGNNFAISALSSINCYKQITFGNDVQFSWNCLVMDSDTHKIFDKDNKEIIFEDKIWIGCNCTILKGTHLSSNTVIGSNSVLTNKSYPGNCIIAGQPAEFKKEIKGWKL